MRYYLSLGSNIGDRKTQLDLAIEKLLSFGNKLISKSSLYETEPIEMPKNTPSFYNQGLIIESEMDVLDFLSFTKDIEKGFGRMEKGLKKDRSIDIDIIFCDELVVRQNQLTIPHPKMHLRRFVLQPFLEICPDFVHPKLKQNLRTLAEKCLDKKEIKKI